MGELDLVEQWRARQKNPDELNNPPTVWTRCGANELAGTHDYAGEAGPPDRD